MRALAGWPAWKRRSLPVRSAALHERQGVGKAMSYACLSGSWIALGNRQTSQRRE
jgi:hypothetical protein